MFAIEPTYFVVPGAMLVFVFVGIPIIMKVSEKKHSQYRIGELAERMGLQVIEGDPSANLVMGAGHYDAETEKVGGRIRQFVGDEADTTSILLRGAPHGRPTEFVYFLRTEKADRVAVKFVKQQFDCRFSLQVPVELPPFELVLRKRPKAQYAPKASPEWGLPQQSFGDPDLDGRYTLTARDPRLGPALVPAMVELAEHKYLHVQANGRVMQSVIPEDALMFSIMYLEWTQRFLEWTANILTGPVHAR